MEAVIRQAISDVLAELGLEPVDFVVEHPGELSHGDYASNVALVTAKAAGKNPRELAEAIREALVGKIEYVDEVSVAGPGFINFTLTRDFFVHEITRSRELGDAWGKNDTEAGEEVIVEYTSPNLFKPLHVGNIVGNIIGESFTRLFEFSGATVRRMNYPSDIGLPVAKAVWGLKQTGGDVHDIEALGKAYQVGNEAYENEGEEKLAIDAINQALYEDSDAELTKLREQGVATSLSRVEALCELLGTTFDGTIKESQVSAPGAAIVREHIGDVFAQSDGAVVYQGEKVGLHTRVFLNSKGLPTYEAKDVGHFQMKHHTYPDWTKSIIVTGVEQAEYFKVVFAALSELFPEVKEKQLEHIPTGFLTLSTGKMSSRAGNVLTAESLLTEVGESAKAAAADSRTDDLERLAKQVAVAALKYQILRHGVGSNIVFDKNKALSFEGDSGPYLQYTYARICSVLEKAAAVNVLPQTRTIPETPYDIEKLLYRFPEVIESALKERAPHQLATFLTQIAGTFNTFYATEKIADSDDELAPYKAAIADAVRQTLKNGLWVLGIEAPERM